MFNMMIMEKELYDEYCTWLFNILFELKERIDMSRLSDFHKRFYGRISEIIFNVWLCQKIKEGKLLASEMMEIPCVHMEKINWWNKGMAFLAAKFLGIKYEGSF